MIQDIVILVPKVKEKKGRTKLTKKQRKERGRNKEAK
jgi:hypothetical protein